MGTKTCIHCGQNLPEDFFYKGQGRRCKACSKKFSKEYWEKYRHLISEQKKGYYKAVIVERREQRRVLKYGANKIERKIKSKQKEIENRKKYYVANKEKYLTYGKNWAKNNRVYINKKLKERLEKDPLFRIAGQLRTRLYLHLKGKNTRKKQNPFTLTGCTLSALKSHLESLFLPGMSWENHTRYGWHIDHIKPCSSFDLTKKEEQYKCFHYTNLQPLWATFNISKGDKFEEAAT